MNLFTESLDKSGIIGRDATTFVSGNQDIFAKGLWGLDCDKLLAWRGSSHNTTVNNLDRVGHRYARNRSGRTVANFFHDSHEEGSRGGGTNCVMDYDNVGIATLTKASAHRVGTRCPAEHNGIGTFALAFVRSRNHQNNSLRDFTATLHAD
jgi:hypothetical protein